MSTSPTETPKPYDRDKFLADFQSRVQGTIEAGKPFSYDGLPIVDPSDMALALGAVLRRYVAQNDAVHFLAVFTAFERELDSPQLEWAKESMNPSKIFVDHLNAEIARLRKEGQFSLQELLMKVLKKTGVSIDEKKAKISSMTPIEVLIETESRERGAFFDRSIQDKKSNE